MTAPPAGAPGTSPPELVPLRWWHLTQVLALEAELFGDERWSESMFWSELALCPPGLGGSASRRYWAAVAPEGREQLLGYAGLAVSAGEGYVQTIGVTGSAQRSGVGTLLLRRLLTDAVELSAGICWLEVRADNAGAQAMYERFGFRLRGRRRGYYQPSGTDALVMSVPLPARLPAPLPAPRSTPTSTSGDSG